MTFSARYRRWSTVPVLLVHHCWQSRFSYLLSLLLLLQRTPVIRLLVDVPRQLAPRFADILRCVTPLSVAAGTMHSVTGATGVVPVRPSTNPAQAKVGESFTWVFRTTGEKAKSYSFVGLPPGITDSGVVRSAVSSISGIPTTPGQYKVKIIGWENTRQRGRKTPTYTLTLNIEGGAQPPEITSQPVGGSFNEGTRTTLTVKATGTNLAYRWLKDGQPITAETPHTNTLSIESLTDSDTGSYSVEISNGGGTLTSNAVDIQVHMLGSFPYWQSTHGITSPQEDSDNDGMTNLVEYALGTDPNRADIGRPPEMRLERTGGQTRLHADFDLSTEALDSIVQVEASDDLANPQWTPIQDGTEGATVTRSESKLSVSIPVNQGHRFFRLTVSLKP